jgi:hypothetical protein
VLVEAVVDETPAAPLAQPARERLPERVLDEEDGVLDALVRRDAEQRLLGLAKRLPVEPGRVEVDVGLPGQPDVEDVPGESGDARVAVEPEERGAQVEDPVAVGGEPREELLRPLEPKGPVDDREGDQVEAPLGGAARRRGRCRGLAQGSNLTGGFSPSS